MKIDLLQMVESGGCSAKISPKQLEEILKYLPLPKDPNILVDIDTHDDAGVYKDRVGAKKIRNWIRNHILN